MLYYGTYTWNDESNASWNNTPTGKEILSGAVASTKVQMHAGQNTVEFTYNGTDEDIFAFYVDEKGIMQGYTEHKEIPAYVPPVKQMSPNLQLNLLSIIKTYQIVGPLVLTSHLQLELIGYQIKS